MVDWGNNKRDPNLVAEVVAKIIENLNPELNCATETQDIPPPNWNEGTGQGGTNDEKY